MKEPHGESQGSDHRIMANIAFYLASANSTFAGTLTFQREHKPGLIAFASKVDYRESALSNLTEMIIVELVNYLKLEPALSGLKLREEQLREIAQEVLKTEILDEQLDGTDYYLKARLVADPEGVGQAIEFMRRIEEKLSALERARRAADEALQQARRLEEEIRIAKAKVEAFRPTEKVVEKKIEPERPDLSKLFEQAARLFSKGRYKQAADLYSEILKWDKDNASSMLNRGACHYRMAEYEKALKDFERVVELDPSNALAYNNRASALVHLGDFHQALQDFTQAIELDHDYEEAYRNRGILYLKYLKDHEGAVEDFTKSISLNPKDPRTYLGRGIALANLGKFQEALRDYDQTLSLGGQWPILYYNRANALLKLGRLREAIDDYTRAIQGAPNKMPYYYNRGIAYGMARMYGEAILDFDKVIELDPDHARAYVLKGLFHFKLGDIDMARQSWERAQELGDDTGIKSYLKAVEGA